MLFREWWYISFSGTLPNVLRCQNVLAKRAWGNPYACQHLLAVSPNSVCLSCSLAYNMRVFVFWAFSIQSRLTISSELSLSPHAPIVALTGSPPVSMLNVNGQCIYFQTATWDDWQLCGPRLGLEPWAQDRKADRTLRLRCQYVCCVHVCVWEGRKRMRTPESSDM